MAPLHHHQPPLDHGSMIVSSTSFIMISKHSSSDTGDPSIAGYACPIIDSTHSDSGDSSSLMVVVSSASDNTKYRKKKTSRKLCKYKYPRTIVEGKKLIFQGKTPLVQSGKEIYEKLKKRHYVRSRQRTGKKTMLMSKMVRKEQSSTCLINP
eukprot:scaffold43510_cov52-Attheya_sp.AAC.2